jgi:hypothetical protein
MWRGSVYREGEKMESQHKKGTPLHWLRTLMAAGFVLEIGSLLATRGAFLNRMVYELGRFPDFFNHVRRFYLGLPTIYMADQDACFPPLAYCFYYLISRILSQDQSTDMAVLATSGYGMLVIAVVTAGFAVLFVFAAQRLCRMQPGWRKNSFLLLVLLSYPFWMAVERGNMACGVLLLILAAIPLSESKSPAKQEAGLFLFAIAAALKLYPAIFFLYYAAKKRWREAFRFVLYSLLLFVVPFVFFGGIEGFRYFWKNITAVGGGATGVTIAGIVGMVGEKLGLSLQLGHQVGKIIALAYAALVVWFVFRNIGKCLWQTMALLVSMMIIFVPASGSYCLLYFSVPLFLFVNDLLGRTFWGRRDYLYAVLFALVFYGYPVAGASVTPLLYGALYLLLGCILLDQFRLLKSAGRLAS